MATMAHCTILVMYFVQVVKNVDYFFYLILNPIFTGMTIGVPINEFKTDLHDITEILLKVALNTITVTHTNLVQLSLGLDFTETSSKLLFYLIKQLKLE
jgi:hypothetical protein